MGSDKASPKAASVSMHALVAVAVLSLTTFVSIPRHFGGTVDFAHVWWYGWVTCVSTGLGVLPFVFVSEISSLWLGVSNALAAGFMTAASMSLFIEGIALPDDGLALSCATRVGIGLLVGVGFILSTEKFLDQYEHLKFDGMTGLNAKKALLIMGVMTIHSFTEGVAIGVSFAKEAPKALGLLISATLAIHNVPEGLAISLVLVPRGLSTLHTGLWCVFSSLPQPLMAVFAFYFVEHFTFFVPIGLGFAGGAMIYVGVLELVPEALKHISKLTTAVTVVCSMAFMYGMQLVLEHEI